MVKNLFAIQETQIGKIPWRTGSQPTSVFLPEESHGQRSVVGYSPSHCNESDTTEQLNWTEWYFHSFPGGSAIKNPQAMQEKQVECLSWEDPLENRMATHSSILAWRIPWTEECGGLQSMGSKRTGHDWVTDTFTSTFKASFFYKRIDFMTLWEKECRKTHTTRYQSLF